MTHDPVDWNDLASIAQAQAHLRQKLRKSYRGIDDQWVEASIEDALMHYRRCPENYDASRGSLYHYLELRARSYLTMRLRKANRRRQHEKAVGVLDRIFEKKMSETSGRRPINIGKNKTEEEAEEEQEEAERRKEALDAVLALLNPHDRAGVELLRTGASSEEWIRHLGIESLPQKEQQRNIYAAKDRLMKKLKRRARKLQGG